MQNKQIVLITGASSGFGLLTAVELVKQGFFVIATMRNVEKNSNLMKLIQEHGFENSIDIQPLDVTEEQQIGELKHYIFEQYGSIDILINNAGYCLGGVVEDVSMEEWKQQFETNFFGTVAVTKAFLPSMREKRSGKIINLGSISGQFGFPGMAPYTSSKFAVTGFSESLRLELLPFNIYVSLVEPGAYKTKIWDKSLGEIKLDVESDYYPFLVGIFDEAKKSASNAGDPMEVVNTILKICLTPSPRFRYPIGKGAKVISLLKKTVPWPVVEWAVRRNIGKSRKL